MIWRCVFPIFLARETFEKCLILFKVKGNSAGQQNNQIAVDSFCIFFL
jgi:hypothetical protein